MKVEQLKKGLQLFTDKVNQQKDYLSDLDREIGDGDHGANMARGTTAMMEALAAKQPAELAEVLKLAGMTLISKVGGASGPLYGSAFIGMAKAADSTSEPHTLIAAGLVAIQQRGKAEVGEKTMVDVWAPISERLEQKQQLTIDNIEEVVAATKDIKATKGRASYLGERSIGHLDPGAVSSGYFFEALIESGSFDE